MWCVLKARRQGQSDVLHWARLLLWAVVSGDAERRGEESTEKTQEDAAGTTDGKYRSFIDKVLYCTQLLTLVTTFVLVCDNIDTRLCQYWYSSVPILILICANIDTRLCQYWYSSVPILILVCDNIDACRWTPWYSSAVVVTHLISIRQAEWLKVAQCSTVVMGKSIRINSPGRIESNRFTLPNRNEKSRFSTTDTSL